MRSSALWTALVLLLIQGTVRACTVIDIDLKLMRSAEELKVNKSVFMNQGEWELLHVLSKYKRFSLDDIDSYDEIKFNVVIRRRPLFYTVNLLLPSIFLMVMDQVGFYLPPDSGERVSFKITLLLGYSVFLIIVSDTLPTTVIGMPLIGVYFVVCMALLVISLTETVLIVRLVHKQDLQPHVHQWLKHLVLERVTVLLCIRNTHSLCSMLSRDYDHLGHYKENNISQALCNHHHHHTCRIDRGGKDSMERGLGAWWSCPWCVTPGSLSWTTSCTRSRPSAASWRRKKSAGTLPRSGCRWATCWTCCFSGSTWWPCWPTASPWGPPGPCGSTHERLTVEEGLTVDVEGLIVEQGLMM